MKKQYLIYSALAIIALVSGVFQYYQTFKAEVVDAYQASKPAAGHSWSEMQCTAGICVTAGNKVGMGTDNPTEKLDVVGNIKASGDVCNGSGKCLSATYQTNVIAGTNPVCPTGQTAIMRAYNGTWYIPSQVTSWSQVSCGQVMSSDGTALLVNSQHTSKNCTDIGGTVVGDGSGNNMCKMVANACPAGWVQYQNWLAQGPSYCMASGNQSCNSTPTRAWMNQAQDMTSYTLYWSYTILAGNWICRGCGCQNYDYCSTVAGITQIGCY